MATATTNGSKVIKPDHGAERKHMIFTPGARRPARVDAGVGQEGALAPPQRVGGDLLAATRS